MHFREQIDKIIKTHHKQKAIEPDPEKISAVLYFPHPLQLKDLRSFLGLASYFRRFIPYFATIACPEHHYRRSGTAFTWNDNCEKAFLALKEALTSSPVLFRFYDTAPTMLHTDASGQGIGAVLLQVDSCKKERVVAYASRSLTSAEQNYTITEQECLAVVWAVQNFSPYLYGQHFNGRRVVTDHHALRWLSTLKNLSWGLGCWILRLQQYMFIVTYKSGKKHMDADAISRCPLPQSSVSDSSAPLPTRHSNPAHCLRHGLAS